MGISMACKMDISAEMKPYPADDKHTAQKRPDQGTEHTDESTTPHDDTTIDAQIPLETSSKPKPSPFCTLPAELLGFIMEYLPSQSRAALALVDRTTVFLEGSNLACLGSDDISYSRPHRRLAHLMQDRDRCSIPHCRRCLALRSIPTPRPSREIKEPTDCRGALPPLEIARDMMSAFRRGDDPASLLAGYDISRSTGFHEWHTGIKPACNTAVLRIFRCPGKLALKAETALQPRQVRDMAANGLVPRICSHLSWEDKYPFLDFHKDSFPSASCGTVMSLHVDFWDWLDSGCAPAHDRRSLLVYPEDCHFTNWPKCSPSVVCRCPVSTLLGGIRRCKNCLTDFCLTLVPRPGGSPGGQLLVFTVWKGLGKCEDGGANKVWNPWCHTGRDEDLEKEIRPYVSALWELEDSMMAKDGRKVVPWPYYEPRI